VRIFFGGALNVRAQKRRKRMGSQISRDDGDVPLGDSFARITQIRPAISSFATGIVICRDIRTILLPSCDLSSVKLAETGLEYQSSQSARYFEPAIKANERYSGAVSKNLFSSASISPISLVVAPKRRCRSSDKQSVEHYPRLNS